MATSKLSPSSGTGHPEVVSREQWLKARKELLAREKELTKLHDSVGAQRRRLPMVKVDKDYRFEGPEGKRTLLDLFEGQRQLIVYHFMFDPAWEKGCPGCTDFVDALGNLSMLKKRNSRFVLISRAPIAKLEKYKTERVWDRPWYSSYGSDFNFDFRVSLDSEATKNDFNSWPSEKSGHTGADGKIQEQHGLSVFFRVGDDVFHTYTSFERGNECTSDSYALLDRTPYGRQEDWEDSPEGWPQNPTYAPNPD
jgi:predicted dithiol-disulfide oxidoreductase (DUF899 family)